MIYNLDMQQVYPDQFQTIATVKIVNRKINSECYNNSDNTPYITTES